MNLIKTALCAGVAITLRDRVACYNAQFYLDCVNNCAACVAKFRTLEGSTSNTSVPAALMESPSQTAAGAFSQGTSRMGELIYIATRIRR